MIIWSWNINGVGGFMEKKSMDFFGDIVCMQETKGKRNNQGIFKGYKEFWNDSEIAGYSGTCTVVKENIEVLNYVCRDDGRVLTIELKDFYVVNCYVPNAGEKLKKLDFKLKWFKGFKKYVNELKNHKEVIICGDFNVARDRIDIERPDANLKTAGYTIEERKDFEEFLKNNWIDSFRQLHPKERCYSFWSYRNNARAKNIGWRLDYCLTSEKIKIEDAFIKTEIMGSDHCPIGIIVSLQDV